ncbi:MAG: hypothetical protein GEU88_19030 [Solirubrobacterales bacterium]|nr:hypothetical protein [Solirubrobacterales bacterium]
MFTITTGPPLVLVAGAWLFLALLLFPPFALLFALAIVVLGAAVLVGALGAIAATPFWVVRHLRAVRARHATSRVVVQPVPAEPHASSPITTGPEASHA